MLTFLLSLLRQSAVPILRAVALSLAIAGLWLVYQAEPVIALLMLAVVGLLALAAWIVRKVEGGR